MRGGGLVRARSVGRARKLVQNTGWRCLCVLRMHTCVCRGGGGRGKVTYMRASASMIKTRAAC